MDEVFTFVSVKTPIKLLPVTFLQGPAFSLAVYKTANHTVHRLKQMLMMMASTMNF